MKIKVQELDYDEALQRLDRTHRDPVKPLPVFRLLMRLLSLPELKATHFECQRVGMEKLGRKEPCLILMNHSSFIDLKIASMVFASRPFHIVCTSDGFVGKAELMRRVGCIPTQKFVNDVRLVRDMVYAVRKLHNSILMYPEASYSFDGTATPLPESLGKCLKILNIPVVMVHNYGAFARDPLYNGLQLRKVKVTAKMEYLLSPQQIREKSVEELNRIMTEQFSFDNFRWQQENHVAIREKFRADHLNRVLYKCPHCKTEGRMLGKGTLLSCGHCGKTYELMEYGYMQALDGETEFSHIPDWYCWERECVRQELTAGTYRLDVPVDIYMLVNTKCIYKVGDGRLQHSLEGFHLTGCGGRLDCRQKPSASYSLYSDYYWYEIGDMICIGDQQILYYCFPREGGDVVAKTRLATEELWKLTREKK